MSAPKYLSLHETVTLLLIGERTASVPHHSGQIPGAAGILGLWRVDISSLLLQRLGVDAPSMPTRREVLR